MTLPSAEVTVEAARSIDATASPRWMVRPSWSKNPSLTRESSAALVPLKNELRPTRS